MPKQKERRLKEGGVDHSISIEAEAYLQGMFQELNRQRHQYLELTRMLRNIEARIELAEKTLSLTRDHVMLTVAETDSALPRDISAVMRGVRFVGVRLVDACMSLLQECKKMTAEKLLMELNEGMFRFRTNSPQREIHAAMLRQSFAKKEGEYWIWIGKTEQQIAMRLRPSDRPATGGTLRLEGKTKG